MKRLLQYLPALLLAAVLTSCSLFDNQSTPQGYVRHCVRLLDSRALYADSPEWQTKKTETLAAAKGFSTMDEAHTAIQEAARVAGGKHSALREPVRDTSSYVEVAPEFKMLENNVIHIILPAHMGVKVSDSLYTHSVLNFLNEHSDARGVVLDLRGNTGGNMYPMIAAVSPLLPDGIVLSFKSRKRTMPVSLDYIQRSVGLSDVARFPDSTPVAILTDDWTASSGEATLLCFRGLDKVRTFGIPTAGYASGNTPYLLADGYSLVITESCDQARTGEVFCDDPIAPDVQTETPLEDALEWIESFNLN